MHVHLKGHHTGLQNYCFICCSSSFLSWHFANFSSGALLHCLTKFAGFKSIILMIKLLSCQPRVTVTICFVSKLLGTKNRKSTCILILSAG